MALIARTEQIIRFIVGWAYTLAMSGKACVYVAFGKAIHTWVHHRIPWAANSLKIINVHLDIEGQEHLAGPALFAANHRSLLDVVFYPAVMPAKLKWVAKEELKKVPLWGTVFAAAGAYFINRKDSQAAIDSIRNGVSGLPEGWSIAIFPEGSRSFTEQMRPFKKGVVHIAMQTGLPVVPVATYGVHDVMPNKVIMPGPGVIHMNIGKPIDTRHWRLDTLDEHLQEVEEAVHTCWRRARDRRMGVQTVPQVAVQQVSA